MRGSRTALGFLAALGLLVAPAVSAVPTAVRDAPSGGSTIRQHVARVAVAPAPAAREHHSRAKHGDAPALLATGAALTTSPVDRVTTGTPADRADGVAGVSGARAPPSSV